jgi:hypothetical protein
MVLNKTKILNKYTKVKSKQIKNKFSTTKKIRKSVKNQKNNGKHKKKEKQKKQSRKKQKGGKGASDNDNDNSMTFGFFNTFSSAASTLSSVLPPEISGKKVDNNTNSNQTNQTKEKLVSNQPTVMELLKQADMQNPGDFRTYSASNPFISKNELELEQQSK